MREKYEHLHYANTHHRLSWRRSIIIIELNVNAWGHLHELKFKMRRNFDFSFDRSYLTRLNCFDRVAAPLANHRIELFVLLFIFKLLNSLRLPSFSLPLYYICAFQFWFVLSYQIFMVLYSNDRIVSLCAWILFSHSIINFHAERMRVNQNKKCNSSSSGTNRNEMWIIARRRKN